MNFKPTLWKSIVSVIIGLGSNFIFMNLNGVCKGIYCYYPNFIDYNFLWIFIFILIYVVWSLFEMKKKIKTKKRNIK
jgi:hypothetical protein